MSFLLNPGINCERLTSCDRLRFLIDAEEYFQVLREAIKLAQKAVYILSWDIDSSILLDRRNVNDGYPVKLGKLLDAAVAEKPDLNIYILNWDFTVLFLLDRELFPIYKLDWKTHPRVHFKLYDRLPEGASQHQKVVVIDDTLAFVGGLDLTRGRWDTSEHLPVNDKRDSIGDKPSRPYHDVQVLAAGDCARELGGMARESWFLATGRRLPVIDPVDGTKLWPRGVPVDLSHAPAGISYTFTRFESRGDTRQIRQLYEDAILSAKKSIYMENQYFTTPSISEAITHQLKKDNGPEIILVTPKCTDGWLSKYTMDVLRVRLIRKLRKVDRHGRLHVYFPDGAGLEDNPINVHSKIMIVDDDLATVGSANLNNRSMALDSECNIVICSNNRQEIRAALAGFRNRLLAEHLDCETAEIESIVENKNSLAAAIHALNTTGKRYLNDLPLDLPENVDQYIPDVDLLDPEHPLEMEKFIEKLIPEEGRIPARKRILAWTGLAAVLLLLTGMWQWTPLKQWVDIQTISTVIDQVRNLPGAPALVIAGFVAAGLAAFPFSLLVIATVITFGPFWGFVYAMTGGTFSAVVTYWVGKISGRNIVRKLAGPGLNRISRKLARHGILTIAMIRVIPVAPFTLINLVAGASHINFRDYLSGTVAGMAPGMLAITLLIDRLGAMIKEPNLTNTGVLGVVFGLVVLSAFELVKWLMKKTGDG